MDTPFVAWLNTLQLGELPEIRRSNKLTGERRGAIFGLCLASGLIVVALSWVIELPLSALSNPIVTAIADPAVQALTSLVNALLAVAIYHELRWSKEGTPAENLAAVFA